MRCKVNDTDVYYEILGEGTPILLLHGWSLDHQIIKSVLEPVFENKRGWKRIYIDLPGHGKTPGTKSIQSQNQILELLLEFIDRVIGEKRFVVGGSSLGAYLARGIVHHRQTKVDGLLLIVPLIRAADEERELPPHKVIYEEEGLLSGMSDEELEYLEIAVVRSQKILERIRKEVEMMGDSGDNKFQEFIRENPDRYSFSIDVDQLEEPFAGPSLIVSGRQDAIVGYRDAWKILEDYARCSFAVLDRSGHLLELEQEDLFHSLVNEWLDRVEEYIND